MIFNKADKIRVNKKTMAKGLPYPPFLSSLSSSFTILFLGLVSPEQKAVN